ncbi:ABC transporter substrate-binding protein [Microbacterium mitrae]|uniref:ABC transporter substrate-binding protein n=1 Tax=Microbacterium mitrae TaxID=664640 RepID=A0A5C8HSL6_9MICO|nr:ABC transporter substrate-binding protein [Microbacterium mitrae]
MLEGRHSPRIPPDDWSFLVSVRPSIRRASVFGVAVASLALLAGCASTPAAEPEKTETEAPAATEVTITDNHGEMTVPVNPEVVVALDNTVMQTLSDWDIKLAAAPKGVMGTVWPEYTDNEDVLDIGNHREPNLENVVAAAPELIIGGYRFASHYDALKAIQPLTIETSPREGKDHISELVRQTEILGQVFGREDDAAALVEALETAVSDAKTNYDGTATVAGLITSGGKINYAAPGDGRGVGSLFTTLDLVPAIESEGSTDHTGDEISVEAIAAANPEWLIVLDRDGAFQEDGYIAAKELIEGSEALKNVPAVQKGQIVYLDANFYLTEGIQAYTGLYADVAEAFASAK